MNTLLIILASTLTLTAPENGAKYDTYSPCVHEFLSNPEKRTNPRPPEPPLSADEEKAKAAFEAKHPKCLDDGTGNLPKWNRRWNFYERNAWTEDLFQRCQKETKSWFPFTWKADFKPETYTVEFSETKDFAKVISEQVRGKPRMRPRFLKVGASYFWRVKAKDATGKEVVSDVRKFTTLDAFPRMIGNPDWNWRDHGGGVNADGKKVRQGLIYRTPAPINNYDGEKTTPEFSKSLYVGILGVKSQLDLRGRDEAAKAEERYGRIQLDKCGINVEFQSVDPYYITGTTKPLYVNAIKFFANKANYPILYNCTAGSDRTGTIGVLLDGIIGRTDEQIYDNYELPTLNRYVPRLRYCRKAASLFTTLKGYGKPTIRENVVAYLLSVGITQDELDAIRKIMLIKE